MFCIKCGVENADGAKFCKACGAALPAAKKAAESNISQSENVNEIKEQPLAANIAENRIVNAQKQSKPYLLVGIIAIIVIVGIIISFVSNSSPKINLNDYLVFTEQGYDGYGKISVSVDWDAIEQKYGEKLKFKPAAAQLYGGLIQVMTPVESLESCVEISIDESRDLDNGQTIHYTWDIEEDVEEYVKCKLKYVDGEHVVSQLQQIEKYDAFADLVVTFEGISPNGRVEYNYLGEDLSIYDFSCDKESGLSNGDTITFTIDDYEFDSLANDYGRIPAETEKTYTVSGLSSYVTKLSEIDDNTLAKMKEQAVDAFKAYVAEYWGKVDYGFLDSYGESKLENLTYLGNYLLTTKDPENSWGNKNKLYLVYKADANCTANNLNESWEEIISCYWFINYNDLIVTESGIDVNYMKYTQPTQHFYIEPALRESYFDYYFTGYKSLDDLYNDVVTKNIATYRYESNVDESLAPIITEESEEDDSDESESVSEEVENDGYILAKSSSELLTEKDLSGLTKEECKLARNEIYARHGRKFKDAELQEYFDSCEWYEGTIDPDDFDESMLSDIEIENKNLIVSYEEEKGYR